jgi:hypothetical protein
MLPLSDALKAFAGGPRPLKNLSKAQLFLYPIANPGPEEDFLFCKEVLFRRNIFEQTLVNVRKIKDQLAQMELYTATAENKESKSYGEARVSALKANLETAIKEAAEVASRPDALSHEEVIEAYKKIHLPKWMECWTKFKAGTLFICQDWGWTRFLTADPKDIDPDKAAYKMAETHAMMCEIDGQKEFQEIKLMYQIRIFPTGNFRRKFLDDDGSMTTLSEMTKEREREYWAAWIFYNETTFRMNWADESGVAYDERSFETYRRQTKKNED